MKKITQVYGMTLSEKDLEILNNDLLIAEFMGEKYSVYPLKIPSNTKQGWSWSYPWKGQPKKYCWHELKFHESYDWLMPVVHEIGEYALVSDSAKNFYKISIMVLQPILYKKVLEWIEDNQKLWKK